MASKPGQSSRSQSLLVANLVLLKKLIAEESVNHDGSFLMKKNAADIWLEMEKDSKKNATEISNILLWIATHHPEVLKDESEELRDISVKRLYFLNSWEYPDELVSTDALTALLSSRVCGDIKTFCGYVNIQVLKKFPQKMFQIRLALGRHSDVGPIIEELNCRKKRHASEKEENIMIHIRCGEVDLKHLAPLPDSVMGQTVYISDVSDHNAAWVVKAAAALATKGYHHSLEALHLPCSKVTATGVEAIANGLFHAGVFLETFGVSSPNIGYDSEDSLSFTDMIIDKYNIDCMDFGDEESLEFTDFGDYIPDDSTVKDMERVLEEMNHQNSFSADEWEDLSGEDFNVEDITGDFVRALVVMKNQMSNSSDGLDGDDSGDEDLTDAFVCVLQKVRHQMDDRPDGLDDDSNDKLPDLLDGNTGKVLPDLLDDDSDDELPDLLDSDDDLPDLE